jgi:hypothetical protein
MPDRDDQPARHRGLVASATPKWEVRALKCESAVAHGGIPLRQCVRADAPVSEKVRDCPTFTRGSSMTPADIRFAADGMLQSLATWLRLLPFLAKAI